MSLQIRWVCLQEWRIFEDCQFFNEEVYNIYHRGRDWLKTWYNQESIFTKKVFNRADFHYDPFMRINHDVNFTLYYSIMICDLINVSVSFLTGSFLHLAIWKDLVAILSVDESIIEVSLFTYLYLVRLILTRPNPMSLMMVDMVFSHSSVHLKNQKCSSTNYNTKNSFFYLFCLDFYKFDFKIYIILLKS